MTTTMEKAAYAARDYSRLLGMSGFSEQLLKNHFTLYQGYVTNTNKLADALAALALGGKAATPEYAEIKRRFGWEFNGMRLHEYYFGNMAKDGERPAANSTLARALESQFGGRQAWEADFRATGAMRGIGWAVLSLDAAGGRLFNVWVNEHDLGHLAGGTPLLVLDVFEHAFLLDYGLKRPDYIEAFFRAVDWGAVERRFQAVSAFNPAV